MTSLVEVFFDLTFFTANYGALPPLAFFSALSVFSTIGVVASIIVLVEKRVNEFHTVVGNKIHQHPR